MDSTIEKNREAMLKRLASRNQKRALDAAAAKEANTRKIDLEATEKAFLKSSPTTLTMRTPHNTTSSITNYSISAPSTSSPILSFDEKADKQIVALSTWTNTVIGMDSTEELDLGATTAEACRRIQKMLAMKKTDSEVESINEAARRRYQRIFEKNDSEAIRMKCKTLLDDSGIEESIRNLLSKDAVAIRDEHSVYNDLALQTNLLGTFLCFHPAWLKSSLEAVFDTHIDAQPKYMIRALSQFILEHVLSNPKLLKNKKFAQGSGKPIITKQGREALHRHFLETVMKIMFLVETANSHRVIPNLTRVFTKTSQYKCLDDMFSALTKQLLTGSSLTFKKAFLKIGFTPNYKQSFFDNYDYQARGFSDFSDGLILAKLIETVGELPYGELLLKLRDPAGDRIRKLNNVKTVLQKMGTIGIPTDDVTPEAIVGGKKEAILSLLWSIVGVRVAKERRVKVARPMSPESETPKKKPRRSAVHDDLSSEVLKACKRYGRELNLEVLDLDTITNGLLLEAIWRYEVPNGTPIQAYSGETLWEKVVSMAELELGIQRGLDQSVALFVKMFLERTYVVKMYNQKASIIQKTWRIYQERKKTLKLYDVVQQLLLLQGSISPIDNATFVIQSTPGLLTPRSMNSTLNDATFTVSRDSLDVFKQPKTPLRGTFTRHTIAKHLNEVIEEEAETENDETVVPSTTKKRYRVDDARNRLVFEEETTTEIERIVYSEIHHEVVSPTRDKVEVVVQLEEDVTQEMESPGAPEDVEGAPKALEAPEAPQNLSGIAEDVQETPEPPQNLSGVFIIAEDTQNLSEDVEEAPEEAKASESFVSEAVCTPSNETQEAQPPEGFEDVMIRLKVRDSGEAPEVVTSPEAAPEAVQPRDSIPMDTTQPTTAPSTSTTSSVGYEMTEQQEQTEDDFRRIIDNQKRFVLKNELNLIINDEETANTPELRRILRKTKELKRKQEEVARRLGAIERQALDLKEEAFIENSTASERPDAGHEEAIFKQQNREEKDQKEQENQALLEKERSLAAIQIQKLVRGFLERRRFAVEIRDWREKMIGYQQILERENEHLERVEQEKQEEGVKSSVEKKLRNCTLRGLTNDNLHVVHIAATIVDRLTDLVPSLLTKFVVDLNGIKPVYDILAVADQGFAYTSILHPLLRVLQKSLHKVPEESSNDAIRPLLQKLSPRLVLLMCKHAQNQEFFLPIITSLIAIARRFPDKKVSHIDAQYAIRQTMRKVSDQEAKNHLATLRHITD